jgi:hypothetical protein
MKRVFVVVVVLPAAIYPARHLRQQERVSVRRQALPLHHATFGLQLLWNPDPRTQLLDLLDLAFHEFWALAARSSVMKVKHFTLLS